MVTSALFLSLQTATLTTIIAFFVGLLLARWRMTTNRVRGSIVDGLILLPVALPPTVVGMSLLLLFGPGSPFFSIVPILFTWPATVFASFAVSFPLMYLSARAAFDQVDTSLIDLARTYGFSEWRILWRVMLPLGWPGIATGVLLTFVRALGEFGATLMIAGNIPGTTQTLPLAIFFSIEAGDLAGGMVLSGLSVCLSLIAIFALGFLRQHRTP